MSHPFPAQVFPGVVAKRASVAPGEAWAPGVTKVDVDVDGHLAATVFLDLDPRPEKPAGAAHYTVVCGCDVEAGSALSSGGAAHEAWGLRKPARQTAVVALLAGLGDTVGPGELTALAHEWGHVLHSTLAKSTSQHLSGTRGATDVAELPSTKLEDVAVSRETLAALFRGDEAATAAHLDAAAVEKRATAAWDTDLQLRLARFDLALHSDCPQFLAAARAADASSETTRFDPRPYAGLAHVVSQPATYYAYAYDRAVARDALGDLDGDGGAALRAFLEVASEAEDPGALLRRRR